MVYFSFNLSKNGSICEKTYPQKLVTKNRQTPDYNEWSYQGPILFTPFLKTLLEMLNFAAVTLYMHFTMHIL